MKEKNTSINFYTKLLSISSATIAILSIFFLFARSTSPETRSSTVNLSSTTTSTPISIPADITFAGEAVPIEQYDVKESLEREILVNTYWQSQTILFIKRAHRYFPIIEPILKENGVPDDLKYLAVIESGLMIRAQSAAGAAGLWQFVKDTAKEYNLEVGTEIDERYHIEKSTVAACRYLKKMHDHYKSWALAAAAYNAGRSGVNKQLELQQATSYYNLLFGEETGRYVYRIIALKAILNEPQRYGFFINDEDLYAPIKTFNFDVNTSIPNIALFAKEHKTTYKELKNLNPWLRENALTNTSGRTYTIKLPNSSKTLADSARETVNDVMTLLD